MGLFLEMDESAGELDEALEKQMIRIASLQPEIFKDVMGLVEELVVEAVEKAEIPGIPRGSRLKVKLIDEGRYPPGFAHDRGRRKCIESFRSHRGTRETILRNLVPDKMRVSSSSGKDGDNLRGLPAQ